MAESYVVGASILGNITGASTNNAENSSETDKDIIQAEINKQIAKAKKKLAQLEATYEQLVMETQKALSFASGVEIPMSEMERSLSVMADDLPITGFRRARLTGHDALGLYPMPFVLRLWNLAEADYLLLCSAKVLSVRSGDSVLASGSVSDVCRRAVPEGRVTEVVFAAGLNLWEAPVSLSVEAGVSVSETVKRILAASGTGITLLSFPGADPVRSRPQAFFGRAAECIEEALSGAGARGYLTDSGL